jgi:hypothetical protein
VSILSEQMERRRRRDRATGIEQLDASVRRVLADHIDEREVIEAQGGDPERLRGIPVIGRGCGGGASRGSVPHRDGLRAARRPR